MAGGGPEVRAASNKVKHANGLQQGQPSAPKALSATGQPEKNRLIHTGLVSMQSFTNALWMQVADATAAAC